MNEVRNIIVDLSLEKRLRSSAIMTGVKKSRYRLL